MERLHLLLIEDNADDALIIERALRRGGLEPRCERVDTLDTLEAAIRDPEGFDVILCDSCGPRLELRSILTAIHMACPVTPILIVSGRRECEFHDVLAGSGVAAFLSKDHLEDLCAAITAARHRPQGH